MNLLVTGGAGFIGSNFIHYWLKKYPNDYLFNLDKLTYAGHISSLKLIKSKNYKFIKGDITDRKTVSEVIKKVDLVVHFAAESHVDRSIKNPTAFVKTNVIGTEILLEESVKHNLKHFHHISTDEVFGSLELNTKNKFNESTCYSPRSPYAASKASSDHLVRAYFHTFNLPITITNCSNNYGPFQDPEKFIPRAITNILEEKKVPIYGDGKNVRDWLFVEDHIKAIELVIKKGKIGETYLVGGKNKELNNIEIIYKILKILKTDIDQIEFIKDRPGHDRRYAVSESKIKSLGWRPQYNISTGLIYTVKWYKENESWWKPLKRKAEKFYKFQK